MSKEIGFDSQAYLELQNGAFTARIIPGAPHIVEFGGKPFGDYHASRVLPGYEVDVKADILRNLSHELQPATIAMAIHAQDILAQPDGRRIATRIRGDSGLGYDDEVFRLTEQADKEFGITIGAAVITALPDNLSARNEDFVSRFQERLGGTFPIVRRIPLIAQYPFIEVNEVPKTLTASAPVLDDPGHSLIVVSPGGGSGKFSVAVTEIAHKLAAGQSPNFIKFETFPVFGLDERHPLNLAFLAATADLPNALTTQSNGKTNYDKDTHNLRLLKALLSHYPDLESPLHAFEQPTDMGVNIIHEAIVDEGVVARACFLEVARRIERYKRENAKGAETTSTITRTQQYLSQLAIVGL